MELTEKLIESEQTFPFSVGAPLPFTMPTESEFFSLSNDLEEIVPRGNFDRWLVDEVWESAEKIKGTDAALWRRDEHGSLICRSEYGNRFSSFGWEVVELSPGQFPPSGDKSGARTSRGEPVKIVDWEVRFGEIFSPRYSILRDLTPCLKVVRWGVMNRRSAFALCVLFLLCSPSRSEESQTIDSILEASWERAGIKPNRPVSDGVFLRRIYLDIAGRIPSLAEADRFLDSTDPEKRTNLIDSLLESEAAVSHQFNFWADILRIKERVGNNRLQTYSYQFWLKDALRRNVPYDELVRQMVTARGWIWENGATGYYHRDRGMPLDNMSNTIRVFLGTRLECASVTIIPSINGLRWITTRWRPSATRWIPGSLPLPGGWRWRTTKRNSWRRPANDHRMARSRGEPATTCGTGLSAR